MSEKVVGYGRLCRRGHRVAEGNAMPIYGGRYYNCRLCKNGKSEPHESIVTLGLYLDWLDLKAKGLRQVDAAPKLGVSRSSISRAIKKYQ